MTGAAAGLLGDTIARDYSRMNQPDNQMFLQYIVSLGAHGAHKF